MKGLGVSPGIVRGKVYVDWKEQIEVERDYVDDSEGEVERFLLAVSTAEEEIKRLYGEDSIEERVIDKDEAGPDLYRVHGVMLRDKEFLGEIRDMILAQHVNAEWAVKVVSEKFVQVFEGMDNDSLKARADDVKDVAARVCRLLLHIEGGDLLPDDGDGMILVCRSTGTAELALLQKNNIVGLVCEEGTAGSHSIIMARNRHKPAVVALPGIADSVYHGDTIIVDGSSGEVIVNPDDEAVAEFERRREEDLLFEAGLRTLIGTPAHSADGEEINVFGNAASEFDIDSIVALEGRGVGLYRTEYLYFSRDRMPGEGEQFWECKKAAMAMKGRPVVFRTLDIGGDKIPQYLEMPEEMNPMLGRRAIRYSLSRTDIFRVQLKAILRASAFGDVSVLLPLISTVDEVRAAKNIIEDVKQELVHDDVAFNTLTKVGVMIETPSAALISDLIAEECDFISIGSNDLIQYTMAVDRLDPALSYLYSPYSPSVLRLVQTVIENGAVAGKPVSMCGEMAGDPLLAPILFGMGLRTFSVNPSDMLRTQWILSEVDSGEMRALADEVLNFSTKKDVVKFCEEHFARFTAGHRQMTSSAKKAQGQI